VNAGSLTPDKATVLCREFVNAVLVKGNADLALKVAMAAAADPMKAYEDYVAGGE
jgi:hypothetical protein